MYTPLYVVVAISILVGGTYGIDVYGSNDTMNLVITTHNPSCTALYLNYTGITRLTDIRPHNLDSYGYTTDELDRGINVTAIIWAADSNMTIPAILHRPDVSRVMAYTNSSTTPESFHNPDPAVNWQVPTYCGGLRELHIPMLMNDIGWKGSEPGTGPAPRMQEISASKVEAELTLDPYPAYVVDPKTGLVYAGDLLGVDIRTSDYMATWSYMKENGAIVNDAYSDVVSGYIPPSLFGPLSIRDDVHNAIIWNNNTDLMRAQFGPVYTDGLPSVDHVDTLNLIITTHNPFCTALYLNYTDITRLTDIRPQRLGTSYSYTDIERYLGIDVTAVIWAADSNMTIPAILHRPDVSSVMVYASSNSTTTPRLLALFHDPDVTPNWHGITECGALSEEHIPMLMDNVGWKGSKPDTGPVPKSFDDSSDAPIDRAKLTLDPYPITHMDPKTGLVYAGDLLRVGVKTTDYMAIWSYMKENGAIVTDVYQEYEYVSGYIPPSLIGPLAMRDDVYRINTHLDPRFFMERYGTTTTEGLLDANHQNVKQWHSHGSVNPEVAKKSYNCS